VVEMPSMIKLSQRQYTFIMQLIDELGDFMNILERNKLETRRIKKNLSSSSSDVSMDELKITISLTIPTTFTLAVVDAMPETIVQHTAGLSSSVPDADRESIRCEQSHTASTIGSSLGSAVNVSIPVKDDASSMNQTLSHNQTKSTATRKSKVDETNTRLMDNTRHSSFVSSSININDQNDETSSQWDLSEDLDADMDMSVIVNDFEVPSQTKTSRILLDDDSWSSSGGINLAGGTLEVVGRRKQSTASNANRCPYLFRSTVSSFD
jgi:hypothetical protein